MRPIIVHRKRESEMKQAIKDLEARGFTLLYGPEKHSSNGKSFSRDSYGRAIFQQNTQHSVWVAKLQKVVE